MKIQVITSGGVLFTRKKGEHPAINKRRWRSSFTENVPVQMEMDSGSRKT